VQKAVQFIKKLHTGDIVVRDIICKDFVLAVTKLSTLLLRI